MNDTPVSNLTDQQLLDEAKRMKSFSITNAVFIGFLAGIVAFGVVKNTWGFLTLIPLVIIFKLVNDPKSKRLREIESERKKRKLK